MKSSSQNLGNTVILDVSRTTGQELAPPPTIPINPRNIGVRPIPVSIARIIFERQHYLHSMPGGTRLCFGAFVDNQLLGALSLGVGPFNAHRLVEGAAREDGLTLTRLWLDDNLPRNSESCVIAIVIRAVRHHTKVKFLLSYADPAAGHVGIIYQASNWLYTGLSDAQPLMDLGDGVPRHLRSIGSAFGTHSAEYLRRQGLRVRMVSQAAKHRYIYFVDPVWRERLRVPVLPYPKKEVDPDGAH